jgi:hypothetical protein
MNNIIGIVGFIGSGKGAISDYLFQKYNYSNGSFASPLKDTVASIFKWDRALLEGDTVESREWRENVDEWWANRLNIPNLTPRYILQYFGTDLCRTHFHQDIWIASMEKHLLSVSSNTVISDVRFKNEIDAITRLNGIIMRVKRGEDPQWFDTVQQINTGNKDITQDDIDMLNTIHPSEYSWIGHHVDYTIENDGTLDQLYNKIDTIISNL